jgi:hypothetical protein
MVLNQRPRGWAALLHASLEAVFQQIVLCRNISEEVLFLIGYLSAFDPARVLRQRVNLCYVSLI